MASLRARLLRPILRSVVRPLFLRGAAFDWPRRRPGFAPPRGVRVRPLDGGGVRGEWFHGGGFVMGSPRTHRRLTARLAHAARARIFALDYRLAPEHPFRRRSTTPSPAIAGCSPRACARRRSRSPVIRRAAR